MKEDLILLETAKLAKEKGFDVEVSFAYDVFITELGAADTMDDWDDYNQYADYYSAPTQSLLQKWLRKNHDIHINIIKQKVVGFRLELRQKTDSGFYSIRDIDVDDWISYEEILEVGLQEALKLIET